MSMTNSDDTYPDGERTHVPATVFGEKLMGQTGDTAEGIVAEFGLNDEHGRHHRFTGEEISRIEPHHEHGKLKVVLTTGGVLVVTAAAIAAALKGLRYVRRK